MSKARATTCPSGAHRWSSDERVCTVCGSRRTLLPKKRAQSNLDGGVPPLVPLTYGNPYCEKCRERLQPGILVGWWKLRDRKAVHCAACHDAIVRARKRSRRRR
jgi:hypothetical protein